MIQWTEQAISGIKETLVTGRASFFIDRHAYHARHFAESFRSSMLLSSIPRLVIDTLAVTAMVAMVLIILARGQNPQSILPVLGMFAVGSDPAHAVGDPHCERARTVAVSLCCDRNSSIMSCV